MISEGFNGVTVYLKVSAAAIQNLMSRAVASKHKFV